jgi:hypothetical protein
MFRLFRAIFSLNLGVCARERARLCVSVCVCVYRLSQEEGTKLRKIVSYVKIHRNNPKHLYPKFNGYGDNGQISLKL